MPATCRRRRVVFSRLAGIFECAGQHATDGLIEIGIVVDDDGVFAAHFNDDALDVVLALRRLGQSTMTSDLEA